MSRWRPVGWLTFAVATFDTLLAAWDIALLRLLPPGVLDPYVIVACVLGLYCAALGVLIAVRRPGTVVAALLTVVGFGPCFAVQGDTYAAVVAAHPGLLPVWAWYLQATAGAWTVLFVPVAVLLLVFPSGRPQSRRGRWAVVATLVDAVLMDVFDGLDPDPYPAPFAGVRHVVTPPLELWRLVLFPVDLVVTLGLLACLVVAMGSAVARSRRATGVQRAQLRWLAVASLTVPLTLLVCWISYFAVGGPDLVIFGLLSVFVAVPAAVTVAILRHDLYDVDRVFSTTVTYVVVCAVLAALYALGSVLAGLAVGGRSPITATVLTAVCAAALSPLRSRLQRRVDRRLYPMRAAVRQAVEAVARRAVQGAGPEELEDALRTALRDPGLRVVYRLSDGTAVAADGTPVAVDGVPAVPVVDDGREVGLLLPDAGPATTSLLRETATAAAVLVDRVRLRLDLAHTLRAADAGRVSAALRERQRMERQLHDTMQQRLVALGLALRLAEHQVRSGSIQLGDLVDRSVTDLQGALVELRRIVHGLPPAHLDQGLAESLRRLAEGTPVPVSLRVDVTSPVPEQTAATVYALVSEAITNVLKHAGATRIEVSVTDTDGYLRVRIADDGTGGATPEAGTGLRGLADRVDDALDVVSPPGGGTVVTASLPAVVGA